MGELPTQPCWRPSLIETQKKNIQFAIMSQRFPEYSSIVGNPVYFWLTHARTTLQSESRTLFCRSGHCSPQRPHALGGSLKGSNTSSEVPASAFSIFFLSKLVLKTHQTAKLIAVSVPPISVLNRVMKIHCIVAKKIALPVPSPALPIHVGTKRRRNQPGLTSSPEVPLSDLQPTNQM